MKLRHQRRITWLKLHGNVATLATKYVEGEMNLLVVVFMLALVSLSKTEKADDREFKLTVIILTMDRPHSLARLLRSIANTDFENDTDYFDIEIHVDKTVGLHYQECVE